MIGVTVLLTRSHSRSAISSNFLGDKKNGCVSETTRNLRILVCLKSSILI